MKYHIFTFGCQMNKSDSEKIAKVLEENGYSFTDKPKESDLIIVNMCSIRQSAVDRIFGLTKKFSKWKKKKDVKTALTGCILEPDQEKFKKKFDIIFEKKDITRLPDILSNENDTENTQTLDYFNVKSKRDSKTTAFIPIMSGCSNFCSYCVVPYTRSKETSRPKDQIIKEVKGILEKGTKKITLLGQNVNSYKTENFSFPDLLKDIIELPGDFWLNFISPNPENFSDEVIEIMSQSEKILNHIHLPVQSGDNKILKAMNRGYTVEEYKKLIKKIKKEISHISISTDVIVGFPGETKQQFQNTVQLFKWAKFDMAYIAKYSPRPMTAASKLEDNVSCKEKKRREKILTDLLKKTALSNNKKYLNRTLKILITSKNKKNWFGKTKTNQDIKIVSEDKNLEVGDFCQCKITKVSPWNFKGKLISNE